MFCYIYCELYAGMSPIGERAQPARADGESVFSRTPGHRLAAYYAWGGAILLQNNDGLRCARRLKPAVSQESKPAQKPGMYSQGERIERPEWCYIGRLIAS